MSIAPLWPDVKSRSRGGLRGLAQQSEFCSDKAASKMQTSWRATQAPGFDLRRIGEFLRVTRESKGLSLGDVSEALFLTKSTVRAIESGHWEVLPHPVYVKGYARSYASVLDVCEGVEELLHLPPEALPQAGATDASDLPRHDGGSFRKEGWIGRLHNVPVRGLGLLCSAAVAGFASWALTLPSLHETGSTGMKGMLTAFQAAAISLKRFVLL